MLCYVGNNLFRNKSTCMLNFNFFLVERTQLQPVVLKVCSTNIITIIT